MGHWVTIDGNHVYINESGKEEPNNGKYNSMIDANTNAREILKTFKEDTKVEISINTWRKIPLRYLGPIMDTVAEMKKENPDLYLYEIHSNEEEDWDREELEDDSTYACYSYTNAALIFNTKTKLQRSVEDLNKEYKEDYEAGWGPNGDWTTVIKHELGHAFTYNAIDKLESKLGTNLDDWLECANEYMRGQDIFAKGYDKNLLVQEMSRKFQQAEKEMKAKGYKGSFMNMVAKTNVLDKHGNYSENSFGNKDGIGDYATTNLHETLAEAFADVRHNKKKASPVSLILYEQFFRGVN